MRCVICDVELSENEIQISDESKSKVTGLPASEPCTTCQDIIMDTAYSDGFEPGNNQGYEYHTQLLENENEA